MILTQVDNKLVVCILADSFRIIRLHRLSFAHDTLFFPHLIQRQVPGFPI
jgi:hypothetical protein